MVESHPALIPIVLRPTLHHTIWGGRKLAEVANKELPPEVSVGESWETETSNLVTHGRFAGASLAHVVDELGEDLLGSRVLEVFGTRFPLLTKFIDAREQLSVQVHPNDMQAAHFAAGKLGKTEAWYVLRAEPDARLVYGFEHTVTRDEVRNAIKEDRLEQLLHSFMVRQGDVVFVPAGTVHAIGAGVVLYEIQEYSDITFRLYDYGRTQPDGTRRELHVEEALAVLDLTTPVEGRVRPALIDATEAGYQRRVLVACTYFLLEEMVINGKRAMTTDPGSCEIVSVLEGAGEFLSSAGVVIALGQGDTAVLPARLGQYTVRTDHVRLLRSYVPAANDPGWRAWQEQNAKAGTYSGR